MKMEHAVLVGIQANGVVVVWKTQCRRKPWLVLKEWRAVSTYYYNVFLPWVTTDPLTDSLTGRLTDRLTDQLRDLYLI